MISSDNLTFIINSLTKSEKKNFKLYVKHNLRSEAAAFLKLYERIEKFTKSTQYEFDFESYLESVDSVKKHHLFRHIIQSLMNLYRDKTPHSKLREMIARIEILYAKGLYGESVRVYNKSVKYLNKHGLHSYTHVLQSWNKKLLLHQKIRQGSSSPEVENVLERNSAMAIRVKNLCIRATEFYWLAATAKTTKEKESLNDIAAETASLKQKCINHEIELCLNITEALTGVISNTNTGFPPFIDKKIVSLDFKHDYDVPIPLEHIMVYLIVHGYEKSLLPSDFFDLEKLGNNYRNKGQSQAVITLLLLIRELKTGENIFYDSLKHKTEKITADKSNLEDPFTAVLLQYYIILAAVFNGDYQFALNTISRFLFDRPKDLALAYKDFIRLINLVLHFKLGNLDYLENLLRNTTRFFTECDRFGETEKTIVTITKHFTACKSAKELELVKSEAIKDIESIYRNNKIGFIQFNTLFSLLNKITYSNE